MGLVFFFYFAISILILSAIIAASEAAILSVSYTKAKELHNNEKNKNKKKDALLLIEIKDNLKDYITVLVMLNNFINIVGSIYIGVMASELFGDVFLGVVSGIMTFFIILFGEIIPKVYGEKHCEKIALFVAKPLKIVSILFKPIVFLFNSIANFFIKPSNENYVSEGEIREMAALGEKEGSINAYESEVIHNVFRMNDTEVYEIMIPKNKVINIEFDATFDNIVKIGEKTGCTRFPIIKNEEIVGLINIKDLFKFHGKEKNFKVSKILRPIDFAPETMKLFTLQEKLKKNRIHMAVVVNEHGDFTGIVTFEDIIEELLGDINDEYDIKVGNENIKEITKKKYHINGETEITEFNEHFKFELNGEHDDYTTLNGFLTYHLDKIPKVNDEYKLDKGTFRIIKANKKKVLMIEFNLK